MALSLFFAFFVGNKYRMFRGATRKIIVCFVNIRDLLSWVKKFLQRLKFFFCGRVDDKFGFFEQFSYLDFMRIAFLSFLRRRLFASNLGILCT